MKRLLITSCILGTASALHLNPAPPQALQKHQSTIEYVQALVNHGDIKSVPEINEFNQIKKKQENATTNPSNTELISPTLDFPTGGTGGTGGMGGMGEKGETGTSEQIKQIEQIEQIEQFRVSGGTKVQEQEQDITLHGSNAVKTLATVLSQLLQQGATFHEMKIKTESLRSQIAIDQNNAKQMYTIDTNFCIETTNTLKQEEQQWKNKLKHAKITVQVASITAQRADVAANMLGKTVQSEATALNNQKATQKLLKQLNTVVEQHRIGTQQSFDRVRNVLDDVDADVTYGLRNKQADGISTLLLQQKQSESFKKSLHKLRGSKPTQLDGRDLLQTLDETLSTLRRNVTKTESATDSGTINIPFSNDINVQNSNEIQIEHERLLTSKSISYQRLSTEKSVLADIQLQYSTVVNENVHENQRCTSIKNTYDNEKRDRENALVLIEELLPLINEAENGGSLWPEDLGTKIEQVLASKGTSVSATLSNSALPIERPVPVGYQCIEYVSAGDSLASISEKYYLSNLNGSDLLRSSNRNLLADIDEQGNYYPNVGARLIIPTSEVTALTQNLCVMELVKPTPMKEISTIKNKIPMWCTSPTPTEKRRWQGHRDETTTCEPHGSCQKNTGLCVCNRGWGHAMCKSKLCSKTCTRHGKCDHRK